MKTTTRSPRRTRAIRERKERIKPDCEQAIRLCEEAAARIKAAGDELAARWATLSRELSGSGSAIDLLRHRAWCNVLEMRLKEQTQALEAARHRVDAVWQELMAAVRSRGLLSRLLRKSSNDMSVAHHVLPMLAHNPATARKVLHLKK